MNISKAIIAKSDQLNSSDLIGGPQTVTIAEVREGNEDQPVQIHLVEWPGRPFKPSKTVLRILDYAWGEETDDWPHGARMTVFRDPKAKWAGEEVGGIRVSHLSHIAEPFKLALRESQKKSNLHTINPLPDTPTPTPVTTETLAALYDTFAAKGIPEDRWVSGANSIVGGTVADLESLSETDAAAVLTSLAGRPDADPATIEPAGAGE